MVYDKNYFLNQLRDGQDINTMGQAMADAMNAAMADYAAEQEAARKAEAEKVAKTELTTKKRALGEQMVDLIREYGSLVAPGTMEDMELDEEDMNTLIDSLDQMFQLMIAVKDLKTALAPAEKAPATPKAKKSDDEILNDFLATIFK